MHVPSPEWQDQIIYSLMIDRFEDGDPSNNDQGEGEYRRGDDAYFNGGDLAGITARVPYLKELGVTAVWISPPTRTQWWDPVT
ncbi:MAG: alpha-amylase family glycosyl hydrolase, partial [Pseudomonadota bacterium]